MPDTAGEGHRSFEANIDALFDELTLAIHWQRPSLLLTVHRSRASLEKARQALAERLHEARSKVVLLELQRGQTDIAGLIEQSGRAGSAVFFISDLEHGGGMEARQIQQGLNLQREYFVEKKVQAVFWLSINEAAELAHFAPDFWAFRHRVLEFSSPIRQLAPRRLGRLMLWHEGQKPVPPGELQARIEGDERLLASLPESPEALSMRIELHYLLGQAHWAAGAAEPALEHLQSGAKLAEAKLFADLMARLQNGIAILKHEAGMIQQAASLLEALISNRPEDNVLLMNLGIVSCSQGRNSDGLSRSVRAAKREQNSPRLWDRLGHLQLLLGKPEEARASFEKAIALAPMDADYHESMAACLYRMGLPEQALVEIDRAGELANETAPHREAFRLIIHGDTDGAIELLRAAIQAGQVSKAEIGRNAALGFIMEQGSRPNKPTRKQE